MDSYIMFTAVAIVVVEHVNQLVFYPCFHKITLGMYMPFQEAGILCIVVYIIDIYIY